MLLTLFLKMRKSNYSHWNGLPYGAEMMSFKHMLASRLASLKYEVFIKCKANKYMNQNKQLALARYPH